MPSALAKRARIVLLAADGVPNAQIARTVGVSRPTVIDEVDVVVATLAGDGRPPKRAGDHALVGPFPGSRAVKDADELLTKVRPSRN